MASDIEAKIKEVKATIQALLCTEKRPITFQQLHRAYRAEVCEHIPYIRLGFKNLDALLISMPDVVQCSFMDGVWYCKAVPQPESCHINELVKGQRERKQSSNKRTYYSKRPPPFTNRPSTWVAGRSNGMFQNVGRANHEQRFFPKTVEDAQRHHGQRTTGNNNGPVTSTCDRENPLPVSTRQAPQQSTTPEPACEADLSLTDDMNRLSVDEKNHYCMRISQCSEEFEVGASRVEETAEAVAPPLTPEPAPVLPSSRTNSSSCSVSSPSTLVNHTAVSAVNNLVDGDSEEPLQQHRTFPPPPLLEYW